MRHARAQTRPIHRPEICPDISDGIISLYTCVLSPKWIPLEVVFSYLLRYARDKSSEQAV